jgi:hypothetical protein
MRIGHISEMVLQSRVPKLVDSAGLTEHLPVQRRLDQGQEPHPSALSEEADLQLNQHEIPLVDCGTDRIRSVS